MTLLFIASLFLTESLPLDMPRAEAYVVSQGDSIRLEDRYNKLDLWYSQSVIGRWCDGECRCFTLSSLAFEPPADDPNETLTREDFVGRRVPMKRVRANHDLPAAFRQAIELLSPCPVAEFPRPSKQLPHGYRDVTYWQMPTNLSVLVCAFRKEKSETWYLASWELAEEDVYTEKIRQFEDKFLGEEFDGLMARLSEKEKPAPKKRRREKPGERELLRADAHHSVAAYADWRFADANEYTVLSDFADRDFIGTLTNELATMRAKYAAAVPSPIDGSNVLAVARIYASREEYLAALDAEDRTNLSWTAAYWCQERRELVAYKPSLDEDLLKTFRHEAFHQYLSYAASMAAASPWFNEGYAQYFEDVESRDWGPGFDVSPENVKKLSTWLPRLFAADYEDFYYGGDDAQRRFMYRLAWSVAVFLEKGAEKVRFQPFKDLKSNYMSTLLKTCDMKKATSAAFGSEEKVKLFIAEWKKFWTES